MPDISPQKDENENKNEDMGEDNKEEENTAQNGDPGEDEMKLEIENPWTTSQTNVASKSIFEREPFFESVLKANPFLPISHSASHQKLEQKDNHNNTSKFNNGQVVLLQQQLKRKENEIFSKSKELKLKEKEVKKIESQNKMALQDHKKKISGLQIECQQYRKQRQIQESELQKLKKTQKLLSIFLALLCFLFFVFTFFWFFVGASTPDKTNSSNNYYGQEYGTSTINQN